MSDHIQCPSCLGEISTRRVGGKIACAAAGLILGKNNPLAAALCGVGGLLVGFLIDRVIKKYVDPVCPECGVAIRIVGGSL